MASVAIIFISLHLVFLHCQSYNIKFAAQVALKYFPTCSIITLTTDDNPGGLRAVSDLSLEFNGKVPTNVPSSSQLILGLRTVQSIDGARDLHSHTPYCRVVITFADGSDFNASTFLGLITPREFPISLRDVDHYIFLTGRFKKSVDQERRLAEAILLSDIATETRYKILVTSENEKSGSKVLAFCLYCDHTVKNPRGKDAVVVVQQNGNEDVNSLFPTLTKNMHGHPLKVVGPTKYVSLYEMEKIDGSKWYRHKRGLFTEFFLIMQHKLNFSYLLKPCSGFGKIPEGNTGTLLPSGRWAGCVGDIYYKVADLSLGGSPAGDRLHYVDFSTNMRYDYVQFFTHGPKGNY